MLRVFLIVMFCSVFSIIMKRLGNLDPEFYLCLFILTFVLEKR